MRAARLLRPLGALAVLAAAAAYPAPAPAPDASGELEPLRKLIRDGGTEQAEREARRLLERVEGNEGPASQEAADVLDVIVLARAHGGKLDEESFHLAERALAIRAALSGPDDVDVVPSLTNLARLHALSGRAGESRPLFERALALRRASLGPDHPDVAESLYLLGIVVRRSGEYAAARALLEEALAIRERHLPPDDPAIGQSLLGLANVLKETGAFEEARPLYERALTLTEAAYGPHNPDVAVVLTSLGGLLVDSGELAAARPLLDRALRINEAAFGPDHFDVASSLRNLGGLLSQAGDYAEARRVLERALAIREAVLGPDVPEVASALDALGLVLWKLGDFWTAKERLERALAIREDRLPAGHPDVAQTLNNLAVVVRWLGDVSRGRLLHERALEIYEAAFGPDHPKVGLTLHELAQVAADQGDRSGARKLWERAHAIRETALGPDHPAVASTLLGLGDLLSRMGDDAAARPLLARALAIRETALGADHHGVAEALVDLAWSAWRTGDRKAALAHAARASGIVERHVRDAVATLPERQALRLVATRQRPEEVLFTGLLTEGQDGEAWLDACLEWTLRRRQVVLDALAERHRSGSAGESPEARLAWERLAAARQHLAALAVAGADERRPEAYRTALVGARDARDRAEEELARLSARFRGQRSLAEAGPAEVVRALPSSSALVEVVRVRVRDDAGPELRDVALVLRADGRRSFADLGPAATTDQLVADWTTALRETAGLVAATGPAASAALARIDESGAPLRQAAWDPVLARVGSVATVFLAPDGPLHRVNVAALPAPGGGFLAERAPEVHLVGSGRDLVRFAASAARRRGGRGLLALGAPDFEAEPARRTAGLVLSAGPVAYRSGTASCAALSKARWRAIPESAREAERVAALFEPREPASVLRGGDASEERFKLEAGGKRVLHLATHGFFLGNECSSSFGDAADSPRPLDNPLLLSGLVLAGANRAGAADAGAGEDGILTAEEIAALDLGSVDLAVLSACDTGAGESAGGEGILGLRRAFEVAGARAVVMSLWPVPDRQAREWMNAFYRERLAGASMIAASRRARMAVLATLREQERSPHPYLWSGFVTAGDWR